MKRQKITSKVQPQVFPICIAATSAHAKFSITFSVSNRYLAINGISRGVPGDTVPVNPSQIREVTLRTKSPGNTPNNGTTLQLEIQNINNDQIFRSRMTNYRTEATTERSKSRLQNSKQLML